MERVKNVRYDLVILELRDDARSIVAYRRVGLPNNEHRLEVPLKYDTRYAWTVRARFDLDGRQRVTEWSFSPFGKYLFATPKQSHIAAQ
jgi:hypothetical protein